MGAPTTAEIEKRVDALLARMTLEEKIDYIGGHETFYVRPVERLGLPALRMADGPIGVRNYGPSTTYAAGIALAASWDRDLARRVGAMLGRDARARGVHIMLAPGVNLYRAPLCGRNFEYFGEDPFLAARLTVAYIEGMQGEGVSATVKHFVANNSEFDRNNTSSDIDERTMRELYLPAFEAAVKEARVGAVMCAYNLVNGLHMTEHAPLLNGLLKQEWGFDGIVMSDWDATYDAVAAANAGLDLEMPSGKLMNRDTLLPAVRDGRVAVATIDDKVRRILRKAAELGWLDRPQADPAWPPYGTEGRQLALESARAGMVLLKNDGGLLPLGRAATKTVAVIGPLAYPAVPVGGGSAQVQPFSSVSYLQGIADHLGREATVLYAAGVPTLPELFRSSVLASAPTGGEPGLRGEYFTDASLAGAPAVSRVDPHIDFSWDRPLAWPPGQSKQFSARWTGCFVPPATDDYTFVASTYGLDIYRLYLDGELIMDRAREQHPIGVRTVRLQGGRACAVRLEYVHVDYHARLGFGVRRTAELVDPAAKALAARADAVVVLVGFDPTTEREGYDRTFELPVGQDELIAAVREANDNVVVAITSGGAVDMTCWLERVPAVVQAWYPGQEGGVALAELLFGGFSPSGKLPVTFERRWEDSAVHDSYYPQHEKRIAYSEGVFLGYRHFDRAGKKPLFPFGHGLSYTTFAYANLIVSPQAMPAGGAATATVTVAFDVTNTGAREGAEVAQVYVGDRHAAVPRPVKELKGFARVTLAPGETRRVEIALDRRALSYFDEKTRQWRADPGTFEVLVGASAERIELRGTLTLA